MSEPLQLRVVKLGGSVLEQPDYAQAVHAWLGQQPARRNAILVGGGKPVDAIRELAAQNSYSDELLHWLCVDLMDASFRLVASQFPTWHPVTTAQQLTDWLLLGHGVALVHVHAFYRQDALSEVCMQLPIGWQTTSDSLSAHLAIVLGADELVLMKSCEVPDTQPIDWRQLARDGIVDEAFPQLARQVRSVRCCRL